MEQETWIIPRGDYGYRLTITCYEADGITPYDITGYEPHWKMWIPGASSVVVKDLTLTVLDGPAGKCYYDILDSDFPSEIIYEGEIELHKTGVVESSDNFMVEVARSG